MARKFLRWLAYSVLVLAVLIGIARATVLRWWRIPGGDPYLEASIAPTLRAGELVLLLRLAPPRPGDLVLCPEPHAPDRIVIARVAALEGDEVKVEGTHVFVNGRRSQSEGSCDQMRFRVDDPSTGAEHELTCTLEELAGGLHERGDAPESRVGQKVELSVGDGELFLLSDDRAFPYDSRDFGMVDAETCREKIVFRLLGEAGFGDVSRRFNVIR